jgi:hypothetical protein
MNCKALMLFASAALAAGITSAKADTLLASPSNTGYPGWYLGTGNPNGGFTVATSNGIELGLRAKLRQNGSVIHPDITNTYTVPNGPETLATSGGVGSNPNDAAWNYEFSIDLRPLDVGSLTLADITANTSLTITDLTTLAAPQSVNPLTYWGDDVGYGSLGQTSTSNGAEWGAQNSENPAFASFPLAGYKLNNTDNYSFTLNVENTAGSLLATDTINVDVVPTPLPASVSMGLVLLGGLFVVTKRRATPTTA